MIVPFSPERELPAASGAERRYFRAIGSARQHQGVLLKNGSGVCTATTGPRAQFPPIALAVEAIGTLLPLILAPRLGPFSVASTGAGCKQPIRRSGVAADIAVLLDPSVRQNLFEVPVTVDLQLARKRGT